MSSDRPNSETIEQTKQQIRSLVSEIAQLSKSDLSPEEYYAAFLQRIVSALAAVGGAVWLSGESRRPELRYQINLSETLLDAGSEEAGRHVRLLQMLMASGEPQLIPPQSSAGDESAAGNPTNFLLVVVPLLTDGKVEGLVEIFQRPDSQPATQRGYLRFLVQMCELAGEWLKSQKLRALGDRHSLWAKADAFARLVHESLDSRETCYTIANEGRRLIGCDRVSVAIKKGNKCIVEAISGQDTIEDRSNIVTFLNQLATRVSATEEPLWYDGNTADLPPQVEEAVESYVDESYAKSLAVLPLRRPKTAEERTNERHGDQGGDATQETNEGNEIIGALIVEQIETDLPHEVIAPRIDLVYEHSARSLTNSLDHSTVLFMPILKAISKLRWLVQARNLPKTITVTAAVLIVLGVLFLMPADFDLKAKGVVQPVVRREVFATGAGRVGKVYVKDKHTVYAPVVKPGEAAQVETDQIVGRVVLKNEEDLKEEEDVLQRYRYRYLGPSASLVLALQDFANNPDWADVTDETSDADVSHESNSTPLVQLINEDLEFELEDVAKQLRSTIEQLSAARRTLTTDRTITGSDRIALAKRIDEYKVTQISLETQLKLLYKKKDQLTVYAPISGKVILNWDVEKSLLSRTVEPGQVLMTVANLDKEWELELYMREGRMRHVNRARGLREEDLAAALAGVTSEEERTAIQIEHGLEVDYILATDPGSHFKGKVKSVSSATQVHEQEGSSVRIRVHINKEEIAGCRPGATVTGGVKCGRASLGYTWFYEVIDWVNANLLF